MKSYLSVIAIASLTLGCGTGDSNDNKAATVADLSLSEAVISPDDRTRLDVDFTYARERVLEDEDNVVIKLLIPAAARYIPGSAEVRGTPDDDVNPEEIERCSDGSQVLTFDLDDQDLSVATNAPDAADATLRLDIRAAGPLGSANLEGRAGYNFSSGDCAEFIPQAAAILTVE